MAEGEGAIKYCMPQAMLDDVLTKSVARIVLSRLHGQLIPTPSVRRVPMLI
jgi:hypothetical protein